MKHTLKIYCSVFVLMIFQLWLSGQDYKNEKQLIKGANEAFDGKKYDAAVPLFSTLVSNYPKDPTYNYKYGASLLYGTGDKEKPIRYLKFAVSRPEVDPIAYFYYAEALHLNYEFDKAIKFYKKFKNQGKASDVKRLTVENQIRQCENGKTLLKSITDLIVLNEKKLRVQDFYKVYDLSAQGGQILVKIDEFRSPYEIKNNINGIFYFPKNAEKIFFSSHTTENKDGKDLYYAIRNKDGSWSKPISLGDLINTPYDEDYPYMSADGTTLYFASKGHNSLGGYDIFVSRLDTNSGTWTKPKNLDFAINTPADDYLFIPNSSGETAYFASSRETPVGETSVYQINVDRVPLDFTFVYGSFSSETTKNATIKIKDVSSDAIIGEYKTDEQGKYKIKLPNEGKFQFIVDYEGSSVAHSGEVDLQGRSTFKPLKQEMIVMNQGAESEKLIIKNLVDEEVAEEVSLPPEFFKEKAKLKINKDKYKDRKPKLIEHEETQEPVAEMTDETQPQSQNSEEVGKAASDLAKEKVVDTNVVASGPSLSIGVEAENEVVDSESQSEDASTEESADNSNENTTFDEGTLTESETNDSGQEETSGESMEDAQNVSGSAYIPNANATRSEIDKTFTNNAALAIQGSEILMSQSDVAMNVADRSSAQAEKAKVDASTLLADIDVDSEEGKRSEQYVQAQELLQEADYQTAKAKYANQIQEELATVTTNMTALKQEGAQLTTQLSAKEDDQAIEAIKGYNEKLTESASESYSLENEWAAVQEEYNKEEVEHMRLKNEVQALEEEITDSQSMLDQKQKEKETAKGKRLKELETEIESETLALAEERKQLESDQQRLATSEKTYVDVKAKHDAFKEMFEELQQDESYQSKVNVPNLIAGTGKVEGAGNSAKEGDMVVEELSDQSPQENTTNLDRSNSEEDNETFNNNVTSSQTPSSAVYEEANNEDGTIEENAVDSDVQEPGMEQSPDSGINSTTKGSTGLAKSSVPKAKVPEDLKNLSVDVPEVNAVDALEIEPVEGDSISDLDQKLLPGKESQTTAFAPENTLKALDNEDQSVRGLINTGYHQTYMNEFMELAEEDNGEDKAVKTYVLNQSWTLDIDRELQYLEGVKENAPAERVDVIDERIESLYSLKNNKLDNVESSRERLNEYQGLSPERAQTIAQDYRMTMNRAFSGQDRVVETVTEATGTNDSSEGQAEDVQNRADDVSTELNEASNAAGTDDFVENGSEGAQEETIAAATGNETQESGDTAEQLESEAANEEASLNTEDESQMTNVDAGTVETKVESAITNQSEDNTAVVNTDETIESNTETEEIGQATNTTESVNESNSLEEDFTEGTTETENGAIVNEREKEAVSADNADLVESEISVEQENSTIDSGKEATLTEEENVNTNATKSDRAEMATEILEPSNEGAMNEQPKSDQHSYSESGEIIPNLKEDRLAKVFNTESGTTTVEAVVENRTKLAQEEQELATATVSESAGVLETKKAEQLTAKRKRKKALVEEIATEERNVELNEQKVEIANYRMQALERAADNVLAVQPGELKESEKELKRAQTLTVEAEEARAQANEKASKEVKGKKKKRVHQAEVENLSHTADLLELQANASHSLATELAQLEGEVLKVSNQQPESLPRADKKLTPAEVEQIKTSPEFQQYDTDRKAANKAYAKAQVLYAQSMNLEAENTITKNEVEEKKKALEVSTSDEEKSQLQQEIEQMEEQYAERKERSESLKAESKTNYDEYNQLKNSAIRGLSNQPDELSESLIAVANQVELQGIYQLSNSTASDSEGEQLATQGNGYSPQEFSRVVKGIDKYPDELSDAIFKMIDFNQSLYNQDNPIPVDSKMPNGLVYKVQIGAFRNPPPQDIYKGFAPVRGEHTRPGWIRYTAGLFNEIGQARLKRNEIRTLGYDDAFVVAYLNGERISLNRARAIESGEEKVPVIAATVPDNKEKTTETGTPLVPVTAVTGEVKQLKDIQGLMYTVQVGAFRNRVTSNELFGISPLIEYQAGSLYKYGSGIYNDPAKANAAKKRIVGLGVGDAFVTAFYNGNRVSMGEADELAKKGKEVFANEQPISVTPPPANNASGDITFSVQIGAYQQEVPVEDAKVILSLSNLGIDVQLEGDMTIYTAGKYNAYAEAKRMKAQVEAQGLNGAFVVAVRNGKRMDVQEAIRLTSGN